VQAAEKFQGWAESRRPGNPRGGFARDARFTAWG
jgi:hypothetical protein